MTASSMNRSLLLAKKISIFAFVNLVIIIGCFYIYQNEFSRIRQSAIVNQNNSSGFFSVNGELLLFAVNPGKYLVNNLTLSLDHFLYAGTILILPSFFYNFATNLRARCSSIPYRIIKNYAGDKKNI